MTEPSPDAIRALDAHVVSNVDDRARDPLSKLRPLDRLRLLGDEGSLHIIRSAVTSDRMGEQGARG